MRYFEVCRRLYPRSPPPSTFPGKILRKIFPESNTVECLLIRTNKTKEEIIKHYGGPSLVDRVAEDSPLAEIAKKNRQEVPII